MTKKKGVVYKKKNKIKNYIERIGERKSSLVTKFIMGIFAPKWAIVILYGHTLELLEHIGKFQSFFVRLKNNYIFTEYTVNR